MTFWRLTEQDLTRVEVLHFLACAAQLWKWVQSARGLVEELSENLKLRHLFRIGLKVEEELNDFYRERLA